MLYHILQISVQMEAACVSKQLMENQIVLVTGIIQLQDAVTTTMEDNFFVARVILHQYLLQKN